MSKFSKYIQSFFKCAGSECCYSVCLIDVANEYNKKTGRKSKFVNEQDALEHGIEAGFIEFDFSNFENMKKNFLVQFPCDFLFMLTGRKWFMRVTDEFYSAKDNEFEIDFYSKSAEDAKKGIGHFTRPSFNSLQDSVTVKTGKIYSKRIFWVEK